MSIFRRNGGHLGFANKMWKHKDHKLLPSKNLKEQALKVICAKYGTFYRMCKFMATFDTTVPHYILMSAYGSEVLFSGKETSDFEMVSLSLLFLYNYDIKSNNKPH